MPVGGANAEFSRRRSGYWGCIMLGLFAAVALAASTGTIADYQYLKCDGSFGSRPEDSRTIYVRFNQRHFFYFEAIETYRQYKWGSDLCVAEDNDSQAVCKLQSDQLSIWHLREFRALEKVVPNCSEIISAFHDQKNPGVCPNTSVFSGYRVEINRLNGQVYIQEESENDDVNWPPKPSIRYYFGHCARSVDPFSEPKF